MNGKREKRGKREEEGVWCCNRVHSKEENKRGKRGENVDVRVLTSESYEGGDQMRE